MTRFIKRLAVAIPTQDRRVPTGTHAGAGFVERLSSKKIGLIVTPIAVLILREWTYREFLQRLEHRGELWDYPVAAKSGR